MILINKATHDIVRMASILRLFKIFKALRFINNVLLSDLQIWLLSLENKVRPSSTTILVFEIFPVIVVFPLWRLAVF